MVCFLRKAWSFTKEVSGYNDVKRAIQHPSFFTIGMAALNFIPVGKVVKVAKVAGVAAKSVRAAKIVKQAKIGKIYERTNLKTGEKYVGQTVQDLVKRGKQHEKKNKAKYKMKELGRAKQGKDLDVLEQKWINKKGGLKKDGGRLENKRNQVRKDKWGEYGID